MYPEHTVAIGLVCGFLAGSLLLGLQAWIRQSWPFTTWTDDGLQPGFREPEPRPLPRLQPGQPMLMIPTRHPFHRPASTETIDVEYEVMR